MSKNKSLFIVFLSYTIALICSSAFIVMYKNQDLVYTLLYADIIATIIIYIASYIFRNSSIYDPYWSVVPPFLLLFWIIKIDHINILNTLLLAFSVLFWAVRLTYNWIRGWKGLNQEDWRYIDLNNKSGGYYQLVNFSGIHLFPTVIVFVCCLPFKHIIQNQALNFNIVLGFIICFIGVLYEIISDQQLYNFKKHSPKSIIQSGLWKYSRHPNYYGEILFWWGLFIYAVNNTNYTPLIFYPVSMTLMFVYISIPWIEDKILRTRPEYKEYQKEVSILFPEITVIKKIFK
ncbi:MAG: hypothetical protein CMG66_05750 [Candidatus Marinimicrobia bacterium]|nr:hypothetical protein [Candidatus Neomarinimicrobiota bacterium]|tara:strand:+ start:31518 stop:32384 length:867 start_codon:yes stop_codon:yes gene_type:complete